MVNRFTNSKVKIILEGPLTLSSSKLLVPVLAAKMNSVQVKNYAIDLP